MGDGVNGPMFPAREEVPWTIEELERQSLVEMQRQLSHRDPKIRRDAARELADVVKEHRRAQGKDATTEVVYFTAACDDRDLDELIAEWERQRPEREQLLAG